MRKNKHFCFVVPNYPTKKDPVYTFVRELILSIADLGINCSVIAPQSLTNFITKRHRKRPFLWYDRSEMDKKIPIYQPIHVPFLNIKIVGINLSALFTEWAVNRAYNKLQNKPDVLYAHFWHSGVIAGRIGEKHNIPVFVATGESEIWVNDLFRKKKIFNNLKNIRGVIAVSTKNKEESIELKLASEDKMTVIPNAVNHKIFYKINKNEARRKLGFHEDDFIVAYTGAFSNRKGAHRLAEALQKNPGVKSIFIGSGNLPPKCDGILFKGKLPHNLIVNYLNAADVFVLPTLAEGCCNAIIEAMACGLPIISSNLSFNDDILNEKNSIRIDSRNIKQISDSIAFLKNNPNICKDMSEASLEVAKNLSIDSRAKKIVNFIFNSLR